MVHGVGLEDGDSPPHKQNKRRKGRRGGTINEEGQMARTKTLERQLNPRSGDTFGKVGLTVLMGTTATHGSTYSAQRSRPSIVLRRGDV